MFFSLCNASLCHTQIDHGFIFFLLPKENSNDNVISRRSPSCRRRSPCLTGHLLHIAGGLLIFVLIHMVHVLFCLSQEISYMLQEVSSANARHRITIRSHVLLGFATCLFIFDVLQLRNVAYFKFHVAVSCLQLLLVNLFAKLLSCHVEDLVRLWQRSFDHARK